MELSHTLTLNEEALSQLPESRKTLFVYEWLRFLDKVLDAAEKSDIKGCQNQLVGQLLNIILDGPGPPTRNLIAKCLATIFSIGDTFLLFDTVNKCNDILRNKDDSQSYLQTKLGAICCIGHMYQKLGRMMGRSYEETAQLLIKSLRHAESLTRIEVIIALEKICRGMGMAISNIHKEIYKAIRHCLTDRIMAIRCAAAQCLLEMSKHASFLYSTELESATALCLRAFDGANYNTRCAVAKLLGTLVAYTQLQPQQHPPGAKIKLFSLDEAFGILLSGFLRGGTGFLKGTGEIIKGSSTVNREVRVGVTHAYVALIEILGSEWLEKNMNFILTHILDLVANPKAVSSHIDAVYSRKCINFILHSTLGKMLGEPAQLAACKHMALIITTEMTTIDFNPENAKDSNQETLFGQHLLICALHQMSSLILSLGTSINNLLNDASCCLVDSIMAVSVHPCNAARLAAAWCLRCICVSVPSQCTTLILRLSNKLEDERGVADKMSAEGISGYSAALAAVLGSVKFSPLGIPHAKGKILLNIAEVLLRTANQNSRLSIPRTQAGWLIIGSIMMLGTSVVGGLLPRIFFLWKSSFPKTVEDLECEKARGNAFTWQVTLEGRAGALSSIHSFLFNCQEIVTTDVVRRLAPVEWAVTMLLNFNTVLKSYGQHVKGPFTAVRHRLYQTLVLMPPYAFENSYVNVIRMLVSEFTLSENPSNTTCSLLKSLSNAEPVLLGHSLFKCDEHKTIEEQLLANSSVGTSGSGALEHDSCALYQKLKGQGFPNPSPLNVAVIDSSVALFGVIFPRMSDTHCLKILNFFTVCIRNAKSVRADAVTINTFAAMIAALKGMTDAKASITSSDIRDAFSSIITNALANPNASIRCAAAEALGRLAQVVGSPQFTADLTQFSFDLLKTERDSASRTGHSLALGCIHRHVGGMGSRQHLNTSVSVLLALAQDSTSPLVQTWSLYALSLITESGGPMFRGYVDPSLSLALKLLLSVPSSHVDVHYCVGKVLSALITVVGPELQENSSDMCVCRTSFLCACAIMHDHYDVTVKAEATYCLQQLHLFTPRHVNLSSFVPILCRALFSNHLALKKASVSCLRQLAQREAKEVCKHATALVKEEMFDAEEGLLALETGLPGILFHMLDMEKDDHIINDIQDTLVSTVQHLAADNVSFWLSLCKSILTTAEVPREGEIMGAATTAGEEGEEEDDRSELKLGEGGGKHNAIQPRWHTRVFAVKCLRRIILACQMASPAHYDLLLAKELHMTKNKSDYLVLHVSELIRMAFIAATGDCDQLRLEGLEVLQIIVEKFSKVAEPEFPGHLLLEQFQAQVGAALRPAFSSDTASHVTAAACAVCSAWISSGVAKDLNDLRRVHQLLVSSLDKLQRDSNATTLYNESVATLEKLAILKAWAEVYIVAMRNEGHIANTPEVANGGKDNEEGFGSFDSKGESLLNLVQPQLNALADYWLAALRDHALLSLPAEFSSQLPRDGGAFYTNDTMDSCRPHYYAAWPPLLHASTLWLSTQVFNQNAAVEKDRSAKEKFGLIFGISMESLCSPRSVASSENAVICLRSLYTLFDSEYTRKMLMDDPVLSVEVCNVLHRLILTRDDFEVQWLATRVLKQTMKAAFEQLDATKKAALESNGELSPSELDLLGDGGEKGDINMGKGYVFSVLEVCLCLLARHMPNLNPTPAILPIIPKICHKGGMHPIGNLVAAAITSMQALPDLCSPAGAISILPTILYLMTSAMKEICCSWGKGSINVIGAMDAVLAAFKILAQHKYGADVTSSHQWKSLLQSTLAKLIDMSKAGSGSEGEIDEISMMSALSVFILHAPPDVIMIPNLQYPCVNYFRRCFQSDNYQVRIKCVKTLKLIFNHVDKAVGTAYIVTLAPRLVEYLHEEDVKRPSNKDELSLTVEIILTAESLIQLAEPDKGVKVLGMLVPAVVHFLQDDSSPHCVEFSKALHEFSLQWLVKIGPLYPKEFKNVMSTSQELKPKLELAVMRSVAQRNKQETANSVKIPIATPTIKLKTDFTHFSSN